MCVCVCERASACVHVCVYHSLGYGVMYKCMYPQGKEIVVYTCKWHCTYCTTKYVSRMERY